MLVLWFVLVLLPWDILDRFTFNDGCNSRLFGAMHINLNEGITASVNALILQASRSYTWVIFFVYYYAIIFPKFYKFFQTQLLDVLESNISWHIVIMFDIAWHWHMTLWCGQMLASIVVIVHEVITYYALDLCEDAASTNRYSWR